MSVTIRICKTAGQKKRQGDASLGIERFGLVLNLSGGESAG